VVVTYLRPKRLALAVAMAFGRWIPSLERRTLIKGGRPLATGYLARKA
jgi:hypothetical protein